MLNLAMLGFAMLVSTGGQGGTRPLAPSERAVIESAVRDTLSDPGSATFRHNPYNGASGIYCGKVNAKNRFGGYVGYRIFMVRISDGKAGVPRIMRVYGEPTVLTTSNQFAGETADQLLFMLIESRCSSEGYDTGYVPVKVRR